MKKNIICIILMGNLVYSNGQESINVIKQFQKIDLTTAVIFQNFSLPFNDLKSNFSHPGLSVGFSTNLNKKQNLFLQTGFTGYLNKEMGNGFFMLSQLIYQPHIFKTVHPHLKLGAGWLRSYHPVQAYEFVGGNWEKTPGGKTQLLIPLGVGIEYKTESTKPIMNPYLSYNLITSFFYNKVIPISFYTFLEVGVKVKLK